MLNSSLIALLFKFLNLAKENGYLDGCDHETSCCIKTAVFVCAHLSSYHYK